MYTVHYLQDSAFEIQNFADFADADAYGHQLWHDNQADSGIWLDEGEGQFLYALVYKGQTYVSYP